MIQSARSGKQNILEGSKAAQTSKEMEIKLTNVGRRQSGGTAATITAITCASGITNLGQGLQGSPLCPATWLQDTADI